ncbi:MAG TPA: hypothetical protein VF618_27855 [Thermoanaerobaculia bacterium]
MTNIARAAYLRGSVFLLPIERDFASFGKAEYLNDLNQLASAVLSGTHSVTSTTGAGAFQTSVTGDGIYSYTLRGPAVPGACYTTALTVTAEPAGPFNSTSESWSGGQRCAPSGGGGGGGGGTATCKEPAADGTCPPTGTTCTEYTPPEECQLSPIVINMERGGYRLSDAADPVEFDLTAEGIPERITWTSRGAAMAFLALDRNGNEVVDDGSELFGNYTRKSDGTAADNGFDALSDLDGDGNGQVDADDAKWGLLLLWTDTNHNGRSEPHEVVRLASSDITALGLRYKATHRHDRAGNMYKFRALLQRGQQTDAYYDIYFVRVP